MTAGPQAWPPSVLCTVVEASEHAGDIARRHVEQVLRLSRVDGEEADFGVAWTGRAVPALLAAVRESSVAVTVEVNGPAVTVTVTGRGFAAELNDFDAAAAATADLQVTSGLRLTHDSTSLWCRVDGVRGDTSALPAGVLTRISTGLSRAHSLAAVSDGVTAEVRAHLGAAFAGVAVLDPLAVGFVRYVSMDPLPPETAREWSEVVISAASPLGAAAQGRPTHFGSRSAADAEFPGIGEHMGIAGVQSMVHVPLAQQGEPIGVLAVSWAEEHDSNVEEQALLATVAAYTAAAVHRCQPPGTEPAPATSLPPAAANQPASARAVRVLLVDDTADIRELLTGLFARRPDVEVVAAASNGEQAIELAAALQPDVVVLDVAMPVLDGISALPRLTAAAPNARVVVLSALPADSRAPMALAAGATAYVEKSTAVATLADDLLEAAKLLDVAVRRLTAETERQFVADVQQVRAAREFVRDTLQHWNESAVADTILILLSELVTNAIVHAGSDPRVSVRLLPDRVHVEVTDRLAQVAQAQPLTPDKTSGRGLAIVETLAMGWGTAVLPHGKVVWFDVARQPA